MYIFGKKSASLPDKSVSGSNIANTRIKPNLQLAKELRKPIIRNFKKRTVDSGFKDNIWGVALADMQSLSKYHKRIRYLLCAIDFFSKYIYIYIYISEARKPNKIWVNKESKFYNNSFEKLLKDNDIEMYSVNNKGKFVIAERFIRTLKKQDF